MNTSTKILAPIVGIACLSFAALHTGCASNHLAVVAATGTTIGLELAENPATQAPQMKFGYNRAELALVNTNVFQDDLANVLMELKYSQLTSTNGGIYQRLAVGREAVLKGSVLMMLRDSEGRVNGEDFIKAAEAVNKIQLAPKP